MALNNPALWKSPAETGLPLESRIILQPVCVYVRDLKYLPKYLPRVRTREPASLRSHGSVMLLPGRNQPLRDVKCDKSPNDPIPNGVKMAWM